MTADDIQLPLQVDEVPPPSEFTYNGVVDADDVIGFAEAYVDGGLAADQNLDGEVDIHDLVEFMEGVEQ